MAALHCAVTFTQVYGVAFAVAEHLYLNMAHVRYKTFEIDRSIAKRLLGLAACLNEQAVERFCIFGNPHTAPTAASTGLYQDRKSDFGDCVLRIFWVAECLF